VRLSAFMVGEKAQESVARRLGITVSEVATAEASCPSSKQGGKCLDCRACWNREQFVVSYLKHWKNEKRRLTSNGGLAISGLRRLGCGGLPSFIRRRL